MDGDLLRPGWPWVSVPKYLDRLNKSLKWFGQSTDCLCDVVLLPRENNMLSVILWAVPR